MGPERRFIYGTDDALQVSDPEITALLREVYVDGGFSSSEKGESIFQAEAVKKRGTLWLAREQNSGLLAGTVILVSFDSPGRAFAQKGQAEIHLLAVRKIFRNQGVAQTLLKIAEQAAIAERCHTLLLWTQPTMQAAHQLYEKTGYTRASIRDFKIGEKNYLFYEKKLTNNR